MKKKRRKIPEDFEQLDDGSWLTPRKIPKWFKDRKKKKTEVKNAF